MNYYPFHIGDYASATRHLSWDEDAAYRRLLDVYYTTEAPLPSDLRACCRLVLATTEAQREAVRVVLEEFFQQTPDGWRNGRADAEIAEMKRKQQAQRDKANRRWAKPSAESGTASAMPRHDEEAATAPEISANAMPPTPTPTPTPKEERERAPRAARQCPSDFVVTEPMREWAGIRAAAVDVDAETEKFRDYTFTRPIANWPGAWRNWMRKAAEMRPRSGATASVTPAVDVEAEARRKADAEWRSRTPEQIEAARKAREQALSAVRRVA